jgi:site-specific DNA-cytosine methylase
MIPILTNTYFSGAGLMDIGLQAGGLTLQQSFEIEPLCCDTLRRNFAHEVVQCDITQKLVQSEQECDVMVATYPCTKYSPIADIHGMRTGDDLFLHFFRHVAIRRPEVYVVENVPGMKKFPGHGSNDQAAGLLRTCCLSGKVFDLAAAKERPSDHYWQPAKLCLARTRIRKGGHVGRDSGARSGAAHS